MAEVCAAAAFHAAGFLGFPQEPVNGGNGAARAFGMVQAIADPAPSEKTIASRPALSYKRKELPRARFLLTGAASESFLTRRSAALLAHGGL